MQLNQNEFLVNLMNLIVKVKLNKTSDGTRINDLINAVMVDNVGYGDGMALISVDTLAVKDYSENTSLLQVNKPKIDEQFLTTTDKKMITVTINRYIMAGAFAEEDSLAMCIAEIESMLEKTKNIYMYKKTVSAYENWKPIDPTDQAGTKLVNEGYQTKEIELIDTTGMSGATLVESQKANGLKVYQTVRETSLAMQSPSRNYNEIKYEEMYNADEIDYIINSAFDTLVNTHVTASLLNSDKLNNIKLYDKSIIIPSEQFTNSDTKTKTIGWLASRHKYQIATRFITATSFLDDSTLNLNGFLHFWLISGFARGLACTKFTAKFVAPAVAK